MSGSTPTAKPSSSGGASATEFEPPLACVRRLLKNSLPSSTAVGKDASSAFARACGIFVIYITACANDFARENRRQTITANDVMAAIKELDFDEFTPQLTAFLEQHRAEEKTKKEAKKAAEALKASEDQHGDEASETKHDTVQNNEGKASSGSEKPLKEKSETSLEEQDAHSAPSGGEDDVEDDDGEGSEDDTHHHTVENNRNGVDDDADDSGAEVEDDEMED